MKKSKTNSKLADPSALREMVQKILNKKKSKKINPSIGCGDDTIYPS